MCRNAREVAIVPLPSTPRARVPLPRPRDRRRRYSPIVFPPRSPPPSPRAIPHDPSRPFIVISTRCRGRSVARVTRDAISRRRRKAPAGRRRRARGAHRATTTTTREDGEEDVDERLPPRVIPTSERHPPARRARARHSHIRTSSTRAARARASLPHPNVSHPRGARARVERREKIHPSNRDRWHRRHFARRHARAPPDDGRPRRRVR